MEDLAVLALLECPLCLEQLDVSAKVLPCQHTFCVPCLQRQETFHSQLVCPECRAPVPVRTVEELPVNLLLVRLLEGLNNPREPPGRGRQAALTVPFIRSSFRVKGGQQRQEPPGGQQQQHRERQGHGEVPARAAHNLRGDLVLKAGNNNTKADENWHRGNIGDSSGTSLPVSVQPGSSQALQLQSQPLALCRALCDFNPEEMNLEDLKYHVSFLKGDVLTLIRRVDEHWIEVKFGDRVGLCPLLFTEPNPAAAKLLEGKTRKGSDTAELLYQTGGGGGKDNASADALNRTSYFGAPHAPAKTPVTNALPPSNQWKHPGANNVNFYQAAKGETTNTYTKLNHQTHSRRVSAPPISRGHTQPLKRHTSSSRRHLPQSEKKMTSDAPPTISMALVNPQMPSASTDRNSSTQQLSISVCAVLYSYKPQRAEELELRKGEMVGVYGKFREGWLRGLSLRTGKVGILPGNYVTPVLRTSARLIETKAAAASSQYNTAAGKRPTTSRTPAVVLALDRVNPDGTIHSTGQGPSVPNGSQQAMSAVGTGLYGGTQGWDTVRHLFNPHKGSNQLSQSTSANAPSNSHHFAHVQTSGYSPALQKRKSGITLSNPGRPQGPMAEPAVPSTVAVHRQDRQSLHGPPSILVRPDLLKNNTEKPAKSVRFVNEEDSSSSIPRTSSWSAGSQVSSPSDSAAPPLEVWAPSLTLGRDGPGIILKEGKAPILRRGLEKMMSEINSTLQKPTPSLSAASAQFSPTRHRLTATHLAQSDCELSLLQGEVVLVHRPRPDGRVLITQESSGQTGIFHSSILQVLERLS